MVERLSLAVRVASTREWAVVAALVVALVGGVAAGAFVQAERDSAPVAMVVGRGPEKLTVTVTSIVEREKLVEKEVERSPQSCLTALTLADQGFDVAGRALVASGDYVKALQRLDRTGQNQAITDLERAGGELQALGPQYRAAKEACRGSK